MNEAQKIMGSSVHPLVKAIKAHGKDVSEVTLRRPTSKEVKQIGRMPYLLDDGGKPTPNMAVISDYLVVCLGIPESSVDQLELLDLNKLTWAVIGFFLNAESTASTS